MSYQAQHGRCGFFFFFFFGTSILTAVLICFHLLPLMLVLLFLVCSWFQTILVHPAGPQRVGSAWAYGAWNSLGGSFTQKHCWVKAMR